ncbi:hypothetical protein [Scytonema millei]|uniref:Uncharacterized protein n=1 Tax=Scytonema millei VB511283 TaxID=1245923 RepID=A0A9X5I6A0_9CYAN|nr:hypothetical protein [Scytonema millei]NHC36885.1 hypothetical protein [Scytonema millei VB511283]
MLEFKNLSNRARKSLNRAIAESRFLGHNFIGSEQLRAKAICYPADLQGCAHVVKYYDAAPGKQTMGSSS